MRFGEYLIQKDIIVLSQLEDALVMQMDNPKLKLGEVLVALGFLNKVKLIDNLKTYIKETNKKVEEVNDWVTQEEADKIIKQILEERGS